MWAIASLSPSASSRAGSCIRLTERGAPGQVPAFVALLAAFLLVACGGDDGLASDRAVATREPTAEQADDGAGTGATEQDSPTTDEAEPDAEPLNGGLPPDIALGATVADTVDLAGVPPLRAIAAQNADVAQAFAGLRLPDGTTWGDDLLQAVLRVEEIYRVVYASVSDDSMVIVSIDLSRHEDVAGAQRLQEILAQQPLASGEVVVPIGPAEQLPGATAIGYAAPADPQASVVSLLVGLLSTSLVVVDGNVAVQVEVVVGGQPLVSPAAAAAVLARQQLSRLERAREGDVAALLTIGFPVAWITEILAGIPLSFAGFQQIGADGAEEQAVIRYASPSGEVMLAVINAFADAGAVVVTDFAVKQPGGLLGFTGAGVASFEVLDAQPLPDEFLPGTLGSSARWRVRTDEVELWDDVLAFRRGTVWVFLQGISPETGGTPVVDLGLLIDGILLGIFAQS